MLRLRNFRDIDLIKDVGVDAGGLYCLNRKMNYLYLYEKDIEVVTANILKQEMLSFGGDVAIHRQGITHKVKKTNILLMGTETQLQRLAERLKEMEFFELPRVRKGIEKILKNIKVKEWTYLLSSGRKLKLGATSKLMGIINLTPDSFYSESRARGIDEILQKVDNMLCSGVYIVDIGGESTRPGAQKVTAEEEINRVIPVIKALRKTYPELIISLDTYKSQVAREGLEAGADFINDISGFEIDSKILDVVKEFDVPYVLSHIKGTPQNMQQNPQYEDVMEEVLSFFSEKIEVLQERNIENVILDIGFGFGKRKEDNLKLVKNIKEFRLFGYPLLVGHSRKSTLGEITSSPKPEERLNSTLAMTAYLTSEGVELIRVHDVAENMEAIKTITAILQT